MLKKNLLKTALVFFGIAVLLTAIIVFTVIAARRDGGVTETADGAKEAAVSEYPRAKPFTVLAPKPTTAKRAIVITMLWIKSVVEAARNPPSVQ